MGVSRGSLEVACGVLHLRLLLRSLVSSNARNAELPLDPPTSLRRQARQRARSAARSVAHNDRRRRPSGSLLPGVAPGRCVHAQQQVLPSLAVRRPSNRCCPLSPATVHECCPAPGPCGPPRPTRSPRRPPRGSAARGPGPGRGQAARSRPPTRRSSTASSLMGEATRARRRRPRRRIDGAMMCSWPRLN